jgi:hypothetical protein
MKKIALLGSAPSSIRLAPFSDPSWLIWGCSPGAYPHVPKADLWFEIHKWEPHQPWFHKDYVSWMAALKCPVLMIEPVAEIPNSIPYPKDHILRYVYGQITGLDGKTNPAHFDPNSFGSSLSWMLALAITEMPDEIGLWGVDMAANEEYGPQKDGCLSLIQVARNLGIKVTTPPESDLLRPTNLYGFREVDPMFIKLQTRVNELTTQLNQAEAEYAEAERKRWFFKGALDDATYTLKTWVADPVAMERVYAQPAPAVEVKSAEQEALDVNAKAVEASASVVVIDGAVKSSRRKSNGSHPVANQ